MRTSIKLHGRWSYRLRSLFTLYASTLFVTIRRIFHGPLLPNWSWRVESATYFLKMQTKIAFGMTKPADAREYEDSLVFGSPAVENMTKEKIVSVVKGHWYQPKKNASNVTVLYLHGGGFAYYSKAHENLIALVTLAAKSNTFVPAYRLIPEHPFPAQLEDALTAYRWLLKNETSPKRMAVIGDSAGGNLVLSLLLSIREANLPLPSSAICIAPWTDLSNPGESMTKNATYDWIDKQMAEQWAEWYCKNTNVKNPLVSPIHADLRGLPPIYIQTGSAEILYDMICSFADRAKEQGANVKLESWPFMTHDFQAFGDMTIESQEALKRIGEFVEQYVS